MLKLIPLALMLCMGFQNDCARAENWPQWRGSEGSGISYETQLPTEWAKDKNILWKTEIQGEGHGSPIVWGDKIFLPTAVGKGNERMLVCVDAKSGKLMWEVTIEQRQELESHHAENNFASSTPATDGKFVFTSFHGEGGMKIHATMLDGNSGWSADPIPYESEHGYHHNPVLCGDLVILQVDQFKNPATYAFDAKTGKVRWKAKTHSNKSCSNVPPLVIEREGRKQIVTSGNNRMRGLDPATGKVVWTCPGPTDYCVASLSYSGETIMSAGGYPERRIIAVNPYFGDKPTTLEPRWELRKGTTYVPSPVYHKGHFYSVNDDGIAYCYNAESGKILWQGRIPGHYRSSLLLNGENIYVTSDEGTTTIFKASSEGLTVIATNKLDDFIYTSFAASNGRLYIRSQKMLYCIGS